MSRVYTSPILQNQITVLCPTLLVPRVVIGSVFLTCIHVKDSSKDMSSLLVGCDFKSQSPPVKNGIQKKTPQFQALNGCIILTKLRLLSTPVLSLLTWL